MPRGRWIWLTDRRPSDAQRDRRSAPRRLRRHRRAASRTPRPVCVARLDELRVPEPAPPRADHARCRGAPHRRRVIAQVARVAPTSMSVLLTGETGTGKEVLARLHPRLVGAPRSGASCRSTAPRFPNELMEAELFGYARGAFSGAVQRLRRPARRPPKAAPSSSTRSTTRRSRRRSSCCASSRIASSAGSARTCGTKSTSACLPRRIATCEPLVAAGRFGADLYERLAIVRIHLPPLRERLEDLPGWSTTCMARFAREQKRPRAGRPCAQSVITRPRRLPVARQHPRAAQRPLRDARLQAGRTGAAAVRPTASHPSSRRRTTGDERCRPVPHPGADQDGRDEPAAGDRSPRADRAARGAE